MHDDDDDDVAVVAKVKEFAKVESKTSVKKIKKFKSKTESKSTTQQNLAERNSTIFGM